MRGSAQIWTVRGEPKLAEYLWATCDNLYDPEESAHMAPLPPETTARIQVLYTSGEFTHTVEVRVADTPSESAAAAIAQELADLMADIMCTVDSTVEARLIPEGATAYTALAHTPVSGTLTPAGEVNARETTFISFTGRSNDGRRVRATIFSQFFGVVGTFRLPYASIGTAAQDILDWLGAQSPVITTISGAEAHWHQYANYGYNSHFQRAQR